MICVSLSGLSFEECLDAIHHSEFAEIRIDLLDLTVDQFKDLFASNKKTIATCRTGKFTIQQQLQLLKMAIDAGTAYIDIDYQDESAFREELTTYAHDHRTSVIVSYHNFTLTPALDDLEIIIRQSKLWNADYVKIATTALSRTDCSIVMGLYARHDNIISFCMGELGKITRVAAPLLGSEFTYASWSEQHSTAPGQL